MPLALIDLEGVPGYYIVLYICCAWSAAARAAEAQDDDAYTVRVAARGARREPANDWNLAGSYRTS